MTQETRQGRFVDYQRFARLVSQEADEQSLGRWVIGSPNLFAIYIWLSVNKAQKFTLVNEVSISNP